MLEGGKRAISRKAFAIAALVLVLFLAEVLISWFGKDWWKFLIGWKPLVIYIDPQDATDRKDAVQVYAFIVAGAVAAITATVALLNLRLTRRSLEQQRQLEDDRMVHQRDLEAQRSQGGALQAYYEQIGKLITDNDLLNTDGQEIRELARGQTLTVLQAIDETGKASLLNFLYGAGLIAPNTRAVSLIGANFRQAHLEKASLEGANLQRADFREAFLKRAFLVRANLERALLSDADLAGASVHRAYLRGAYLRGANLQGAKLQGADLQEATIQGADLRGAILIEANLRGAHLALANLQEADLEGANLEGAFLQGAFLQGANLKRTNLEGAHLGGIFLQGAELQGAVLRKVRGVTNHQLSTVTKSIDGAIMTNGQPYEQWREDLEKRKNRMSEEA